MNTKDKGEWSEAEAIAELKSLGYTVLTPVGDNDRYDLVIDIEGDFIRIQVKTARLVDGSLVFNCYSATSNTSRNKVKPYTEAEIEGFIVFSPDFDDLYYVPIEKTGTSEKHLRVSEPYRKDSDIADEYRLARGLME